MAKASVYDTYEDVGMAFTDQEVAEWSPKAWAEDRVLFLIQQARILHRRSTIPQISKPAWSEASAKRLLDVAAWYCRAMELEGISREEMLDLPEPRSAEGRKLTTMAQECEPEDWVGSMAAEAEAAMRKVVTMGRRASSRKDWKKADGKASNRLANCVMKEINLADHLGVQLASHSS